MAAPSIADVRAHVTVGVDTHKHSHLGSAKDELGRTLGQLEIPTNPRGYADLLTWARSLGQVAAFGVEGTSSYGAGLTRFLRAQGVTVIEVLRPTRRDRRLRGKSDPVDADAAAQAVLSGKARAVPKAGDASVEMIRPLRIAKVTAVKARTQALNALKALIIMAPDSIRESLRDLSTARLVTTCARYRVEQLTDPTAATKQGLRSLARRYLALDDEVRSMNRELDTLTSRIVPQLRERFGVGSDVAATLVLAAGDNGGRLHSEAAFSMLCGSSPIPASSGVVRRHRLNRGGDRQANAALHRVVLARLRWHEPTKAYMARRRAEGKSKTEIIRCLKRYVAREVYNVLVGPLEKALSANAA